MSKLNNQTSLKNNINFINKYNFTFDHLFNVCVLANAALRATERVHSIWAQILIPRNSLRRLRILSKYCLLIEKKNSEGVSRFLGLVLVLGREWVLIAPTYTKISFHEKFQLFLDVYVISISA